MKNRKEFFCLENFFSFGECHNRLRTSKELFATGKFWDHRWWSTSDLFWAACFCNVETSHGWFRLYFTVDHFTVDHVFHPLSPFEFPGYGHWMIPIFIPIFTVLCTTDSYVSLCLWLVKSIRLIISLKGTNDHKKTMKTPCDRFAVDGWKRRLFKTIASCDATDIDRVKQIPVLRSA